MRGYRMKSNSAIEPLATKGSVVYDCAGHDYGCSNDDTRFTGVEHVSVTLKPDGSYPFFTVPASALQPL